MASRSSAQKPARFGIISRKLLSQVRLFATDVDGVWGTSTANISSFAGQTIRIRIEAADAATASLVEAGIDDVVITQN